MEWIKNYLANPDAFFAYTSTAVITSMTIIEGIVSLYENKKLKKIEAKINRLEKISNSNQ